MFLGWATVADLPSMKLIIQIPCYNEENALAVTLRDLPRSLNGFDRVEWLIIDDGSTDRTREVARLYGVDHIVGHSRHRGLAKSFSVGLDACLKLGADVIVNTDADNQYSAGCIPNLLGPILEGRAEIVIGSRPIKDIVHFSPIKKLLQEIGSWVVRVVSGTNIGDAPSGFRAITRDAALRLNVFSGYTYTLETIIQAGHKSIAIAEVPIIVNGELRPSRLMKSTFSYIHESIITIVRIFVVYRPFRFFMSIGLILFALGAVLGMRFLVLMFYGDSGGHIQSLILSSILLGMGFQTMIFAFIADLLSVNRNLVEDIQYRVRKFELDGMADEASGSKKGCAGTM